MILLLLALALVDINPAKHAVLKSHVDQGPDLPLPPVTNSVSFEYPKTLTNYCVLISFDAVHWRRADSGFDFTEEDNTNGTWSLVPTRIYSTAYFRIKGNH